jgi:hypothetical protein
LTPEKAINILRMPEDQNQTLMSTYPSNFPTVLQANDRMCFYALQDDAVHSFESGTGGLVVVSSLNLVAGYDRISLAIVHRFFNERQVRFCYSVFFNHPPAFSLLLLCICFILAMILIILNYENNSHCNNDHVCATSRSSCSAGTTRNF